jgi:hypothetical protein
LSDVTNLTCLRESPPPIVGLLIGKLLEPIDPVPSAQQAKAILFAVRFPLKQPFASWRT